MLIRTMIYILFYYFVMLKIGITRNKSDGMIDEAIFIQNSILVNGKDPFFIQFRLAN